MKTLVLVLSSTLIAGAAIAEDQSQPSAFTPTAGVETPYFVNQLRHQSNITRMAQQGARPRMDVDSVRAERAERLAALVNAGRCRAAIGRARVEGDNAMAERLKSVCDR